MASRKRVAGPAFTVAFPRPLPARRDGEAWWMTVDDRELRLSNLDKVFWPVEGYTKGDLVAYYYNVADLILPYLAGRPLTMKRMPNGITGHFFYEKSAPSHTPDWMSRCQVYSEEKKGGFIDYLMVEDTAGLLFMANLGCIEFHPLHARCERIELPDYLFFDLDPFEPATFDDVLVVARHVRAALDSLGLVCYPKTSGATGMQIFVPVIGRFTSEQCRELVGQVGHMIRRADPDRVTMAWEVRKRAGKVFIDHNMNRTGANISAVYSLRPEPGATLSTPLTWKEVDKGVRPLDFRVDNIWPRLKKVGDLFADVLSSPQDITPALAALGIAAEDSVPATVSLRTGPPSRDSSPARRGRRDSAPSRSDEAIARSKDPKLREYLDKRDFQGTPEPAPGAGSGMGNAFVIQKHRATRLHYDVRLERDGVMVSWAVPKGLPTRQGQKHLAVQTEDHPIEYNTFEGTIPKGHYGAGEVRIFDRGTYDLIEWTDRKVSFVLQGERYRGVEFHFVKLSGKGKESRDWLALLAKDQPSVSPERVAEATGAASPPTYLPMLAEGGYEPFDGIDWWFEPKLDGVRTLIYVEGNNTRLFSRRGRDQTDQYPELSSLHEVVTAMTAVLDGEIVAVDEEGRTSFERLQQRINLASPADIERARRKIPVECVAFDVLYLDGKDLTGLPLTERRAHLDRVVVKGRKLDVTYHVEGEGKGFAEAAKKLGLEGVMAKRKASRYQPGRRSSDWRKIKLLNRQDCVILGWTPGTGNRSRTFGALLVGAYDEGRLRWIGQVGSGFTERMLGDLLERHRPLSRPSPPIDDPGLARLKGATFVEPQLVCQVEFLQMTAAGKLRAPVYKRLRLDKAPEECELERPRGREEPGEAKASRAARPNPSLRRGRSRP
jgi:bifunctional non-homologous end joining protein LigD